MKVVYTATLAYDGDDRLDVSRYGGHRLGARFAPSEALFVRSKHERQRGRGFAFWPEYAARYRAELEAAIRSLPYAWAELLARDEVTLCCYCRVAAHCHRSLLAARMVAKGFGYGGERE